MKKFICGLMMLAMLLGAFAFNMNSSYAGPAAGLTSITVQEIYDNDNHRSRVKADGTLENPNITFTGGTLYLKTYFNGHPTSWNTVFYRTNRVTGSPYTYTTISREPLGKGWMHTVAIKFTEFSGYYPTICITAMPAGSAKPVSGMVSFIPIQK
ncbi:hypothetical protein [uncultured Anaerovibrio sp.]|uniref:hypothetical protein n=1 Tax=uncultured Anaerovibrio sp. TaxID=361586 RepID=UPI00262DB621|nr:hypothetical protein [uncultured Anaerovibrio sp.]